jgi:hypothetical protein
MHGKRLLAGKDPVSAAVVAPVAIATAPSPGAAATPAPATGTASVQTAAVAAQPPVVAAASKPAGPGGPSMATTLTMDSTPTGADIEVDGAFVGNTPSTVTLTPGSHEITVKKKGFTNWTRKMNVLSGSVHLTADLPEETAK